MSCRVESLGIFYQVLLSAEKFPELLPRPALEMYLFLGVDIFVLFSFFFIALLFLLLVSL